MALYGILGGIAGNLEALRAVLAAFDERGVKKLLCTGNVVGYNADPDECGEVLRARKAAAVAGEFDRVASGLFGYGSCSNRERHALARTRRDIRADTSAWLRALPPARLVDDDIGLGGKARVSFICASEPTAQGMCRLERGRSYVLSPGSVDAQRKRHRFAECAIFDSEAWTVEFLRLRYDAAATEAKAAVGGYRSLPVFNFFYDLERIPQLASRIARSAVSSLVAPRRPGTIIGTSAR
ncbi:MAG TPA: hypothetical protein VNU64_23145 [Burkholderiales bacterium]|nr:hypothetical protein [Burkholderiales bacterium]